MHFQNQIGVSWWDKRFRDEIFFSEVCHGFPYLQFKGAQPTAVRPYVALIKTYAAGHMQFLMQVMVVVHY